jgi:trehalose/maltose hydrolase-like predicted phosphorylase
MRTTATLIILGGMSLLAQPDTFVLRTDRPAPYTKTYIGNGYLGLATSPWGARMAESFMARVYDHAEGDIPHLAALPAWNEVNLFDGQTWLNDTPAEASRLRSYQQSLNMYDGCVRTQYLWADGERATSIEVETFVSRINENLAAVKFQITPHYAGRVKVALTLRGWAPPKRFALARLEKLPPDLGQQQVWYPGHMVVEERGAETDRQEGLLWMTSHPEGVKTRVAEVAALAWPAALPELTIEKSSARDLASVELAFLAEAGKPYTFYKCVAVVPSLDASDPLAEARKLARDSRSRGYEAMRAESAAEWHRLWETDIVVEAAPEFQRLIHSMLFYLLSSARGGVEYSIPPMGLSTAGYYGHIFWDADTYMFPTLMVLHPEMARPIVMFRYQTLKAAEANARRNGWKGAMYPWEAGPDGAETTPKFAWQNATSEIHVNGDVALAQWQYYLATNDRQWLARYGYPVIKETADFWTSRVTYNAPRDRYEIRNVVSVNESLVGIDNDPYTNGVAAKNLELAIAAAKVLGEKPNPDWEKIDSKLYVPSGATLLFSYPLERPVSREEKRKALADAIREFAAGQFGVMMGITFNPILAVEARSPQSLDEVLPYTYKPYLMPSFNVLREAPGNVNINFLTGAGGFLQQFIFGYSGLRFSDQGLTQRFEPLLPHTIKKLTLRNITIRGTRRDIVLGR